MARKRTRSGKPATQRQLRVGEQIRQILSAVFERGDMRDPDLHDVPVTITEVRLTGDMRYATVYIMPLGGKNVEGVMDGLERTKGYLRSHVGQRVKLRHIPELLFKPDPSFAESAHIEKLLRDPKVSQDLNKDRTDESVDPNGYNDE